MNTSTNPNVSALPPPAEAAANSDASLLPRWQLMRTALRDRKIGRAGVAVLGSILDQIGSDGTACLSRSRIAADARVSERSAACGIHKILAVGYLRSESSNTYRLCDQA